MKFVIPREKLVSLISRVQSVVPAKAVIPILSNVLIDASEGQITLYATDLTVSVRSKAEASVEKPGAITLPARRFFQLSRELTCPEVTIETTEDGVAFITSGSSHFRLNGMDKNEFPAFPDLSSGKSFSINSINLKDLLSNTSFAAARDDSRQVLNGIYLDIKGGKATFVGTDGKRLAKVEEKIDFPEGENYSSIIPLKAVEELIRLLDGEGSVEITLMSDKIAVEFDSICLISKLLTGSFPDYERVIPDRNSMQKISLHREELMTLLRQVSLFTSDVSHSVKLSFEEGELKLQATSSDIGEGRVNMPVDYHGEKKEIAFNPHNLLEILRHCKKKDEVIDFGMTDSFNPGSVTDSSDAHFVIMPMRLSTE